MRFITLGALFLFASTTLAAPLGLSSRQEATYSSLALRDGVTDTGAAIGITARSYFDDENWLERRMIKAKKDANRDARKARRTAAKAEVAQARLDGGSLAAQAKKLELQKAAQDKHKKLSAATMPHKQTTGLPDRNAIFTVPAGNGKPERIYTGMDVRKANFASHIPKDNGKRFGKEFFNRPNHNPATPPIPGMVGSGHEHPLSAATNPSQMKKAQKNQPARIISQPIGSGYHQHMGVIAHDQSRPLNQPDADDHFLVHPT